MTTVQMLLPLLPVGGTFRFSHAKRAPDGYQPPPHILVYAEYFDQQLLRLAYDPDQTNFEAYYATCWEWYGPRDSGKWPYLRVDSRKFGAQRFSYLLRVGPVDDHLVVRQACTTPHCMSPYHLEIKTPRSRFKLDPAMRDQIRKLYWRDSQLNRYAKPPDTRQLAKQFGVSPSHIGRILWEVREKSPYELDQEAARAAGDGDDEGPIVTNTTGDDAPTSADEEALWQNLRDT